MATEIVVTMVDGKPTFVYDDAAADLLALGDATIRRVSHVEPTDDGRGWVATMVDDGAVLGPFPLRQQALAAERAYLRDRRGI